MSPSFTIGFINQMVDKFYVYMGSVFLEYSQLVEKPKVVIETKAPESNQAIAGEMQSDNSVSETREQSFPEYFLYKLYYNYGIKRRMVNEHIALLFYSKNLKGYKTGEYITMLCRHMMLDLRNMRIISIGVPKAINLEEFTRIMEIDKTDAATNVIHATTSIDSEKVVKYKVYKFPEGTMITYNPSLSKYNVDAMDTSDTLNNNQELLEEDKEAQKHIDIIDANIEKAFNQQFQYSTRKVVGTGRFSSLKTFLEMFNENNEIANTDLNKIPPELINDKVLVFNIEHPENRVISSNTRNYNTLCAVFQFKTEEQSTEEFTKILQLQLQLTGDHSSNNPNSDDINNIMSAFNVLGNNMITQVNVVDFKAQLEQYGVNVHIPDAIRSFGNTVVEGKVLNIEDINIEQLENIVQNRSKDFQGYIIYAINGMRTKIMNNKYKELKILKGNKPIVIEQWNTKNLFYLYWRLVKLQMIPQFIAEFDTTGGWTYNQLFYWFASLAHGYAVNLFRVYHNSFVKKTMDKYNIPYSMKPMCGDLHTMYKGNKMPISQTMVEQYVFQQSAGKMFWRLFSGK